MSKHRLHDATHFIEHWAGTKNGHFDIKNNISVNIERINELSEISDLKNQISSTNFLTPLKTICIFKIKEKK